MSRLLYIPFALFSFCVFILNAALSIMGVIHAFSASFILGVLSFFGLFGLTQMIELVEWLSPKDIWVELSRAIGI